MLSSQVCTPDVPNIQGSHHHCTEFPSLYTCIAYYEGFPPFCTEFPGLYTCCAHYEGFPPSLCRVPGSVHPLCP
ncbi:unnamed protein product, partial [Staurois parvus]